jgi:hypothetical protein
MMSDEPVPDPAKAESPQAEPLPVLSYATPRKTKLTTLTTCANGFEAHLLAGRLESRGIHVAVLDELGNPYGAFGAGMIPVKIQVMEEDLDAARALMPKRRVKGPPKCRCGSEDVEQSHFMGLRWLMVILLLGLPLIMTLPPCRCRACGRRWEADEDTDDAAESSDEDANDEDDDDEDDDEEDGEENDRV